METFKKLNPRQACLTATRQAHLHGRIQQKVKLAQTCQAHLHGFAPDQTSTLVTINTIRVRIHTNGYL